MSGLADGDVKQVVARAKGWLSNVLADEHPSNVGLDEIEYDEDAALWRITIGFSRPWNTSPTNALTSIAAGLQPGARANLKRSYRVISLDAKTGDVISMKRRSSEDD